MARAKSFPSSSWSARCGAAERRSVGRRAPTPKAQAGSCRFSQCAHLRRNARRFSGRVARRWPGQRSRRPCLFHGSDPSSQYRGVLLRKAVPLGPSRELVDTSARFTRPRDSPRPLESEAVVRGPYRGNGRGDGWRRHRRVGPDRAGRLHQDRRAAAGRNPRRSSLVHPVQRAPRVERSRPECALEWHGHRLRRPVLLHESPHRDRRRALRVGQHDVLRRRAGLVH